MIRVVVQIKELGSGSFGQCMLAEDHDQETVAVKFIERGKVRLREAVGAGLIRICLFTLEVADLVAGGPKRGA